MINKCFTKNNIFNINYKTNKIKNSRGLIDMKTEELLELIKNGENNKVEFKSYIKFKDKKEFFSVLAKEAVGLANANGGYILLGIEDNGEISGCFDYDAQKLSKVYMKEQDLTYSLIYMKLQYMKK